MSFGGCCGATAVCSLRPGGLWSPALNYSLRSLLEPVRSWDLTGDICQESASLVHYRGGPIVSQWFGHTWLVANLFLLCLGKRPLFPHSLLPTPLSCIPGLPSIFFRMRPESKNQHPLATPITIPQTHLHLSLTGHLCLLRDASNAIKVTIINVHFSGF